METINDRAILLGEFVPEPDDGRIICRCEEVTKGDIRRAVHDGMYTITEIRRYLRTGMGLCQGQTCAKLVKSIVAKELGVSPAKLTPATSRAPMRPLEMKILANETVSGEDNGKGGGEQWTIQQK
ncbi:MAG: (2Fe-2S)-binding protein [Lachnospiraceae bacterium]|jgi:NAD(P)H-nitrite reductase large subunit|nr:(2Fe-2S)-binding protein [Lachnospiraceae bacterium]